MNDRLSALEQDIGFLKALAVEGRSTTLTGGAIMIAAGAIFGLASVGQWAALSGFVPIYSGWTLMAIWMASMVAFGVALFILIRRLGPQKAGDTANRAVGVAWSAAGATIFALFVCAYVIAWRTQSNSPMMMLPCVVLAIYGLCWSVAASMTRVAWIRAAAIGSYVAAVGAAVLCDQVVMYLFFAAALAALAILPGMALVRRARAAA
jgi:hypothetical protein